MIEVLLVVAPDNAVFNNYLGVALDEYPIAVGRSVAVMVDDRALDESGLLAGIARLAVEVAIDINTDAPIGAVIIVYQLAIKSRFRAVIDKHATPIRGRIVFGDAIEGEKGDILLGQTA